MNAPSAEPASTSAEGTVRPEAISRPQVSSTPKAASKPKPAGASGSDDPKVAEVRPRISLTPPPARPAHMRRRHWGALVAFALIVVAPIATVTYYLYGIAQDQYASTVGFSIRKEEFSSPLELFGGVTDFGTSGSSDADILYEFMKSQQLVQILDDEIGLSELYAKPDFDPVFAHDPDASIEALHWRWRIMTQINYDPSTELIEVRTLAFAPEDARAIAQKVFEESSRLINELSEIAREDTTRYASEELEKSVERLKTARQALSDFRSRTQIVDPTVDLQGQMGLLSTLEQQLAASLIEADILRENSREGDPRITQADKRIEIIERRIAEERRKLGVGSIGGESDGNYATILTEYEGLAVDREFAEQAYIAALAAYDTALAEARRKSRYLAAYIKPTLAETSGFPNRPVLIATALFFAFCVWAVVMLVYYSIRDRR